MYLNNVKISIQNCLPFFRSAGFKLSALSQSPFSVSSYAKFTSIDPDKFNISIRISNHINKGDFDEDHIYSIISINGDFILNNLIKNRILRNIEIRDSYKPLYLDRAMAVFVHENYRFRNYTQLNKFK